MSETKKAAPPGLSLGRVVHYTPMRSDEPVFSGRVSRIENTVTGRCTITVDYLPPVFLHHVENVCEFFSDRDPALVMVARGVPYDETGTQRGSWRYPPRVS